jgi:hypothetical protein
MIGYVATAFPQLRDYMAKMNHRPDLRNEAVKLTTQIVLPATPGEGTTPKN